MNIKPAGILTALLVAAIAAGGAAAQEIDEDEITRTGAIADDLFLYGSSIDVRAEVAGEVILIGGEVDLRSAVDDDVVVIGGEISVGDTVAGDVLATGGEVVTEGTVGGGLTVMGGEVTLDAAVAGDALVAGGEIVADGSIGGKLRMMGGDVLSRADVAGSLLIAGGNVDFDSLSRVAGNARVAGGDIDIDGNIGRNLEVWGRDVSISGEVAGDVTVRGVDIAIRSSARIGGDLTYRSAKEADIHPDAQIAGDVTFIYSESPERMTGGAMLAFGVSWLVFVASLILLGTVLVLVFPDIGVTAARTIGGAPWKSLGLGFALGVGGPVAMVILAVTVVGASLSVVAGAFFFATFACGYFVSAIALGRFGARLFHRSGDDTAWGRIAVLAVGIVVLGLSALVPVLGVLTTLAAFVFGVGSLAIVFYRSRTAAAPA